MKLITGATIPAVWLDAAEHLIAAGGADYDVFLNVATPTVYSATDRAILKTLDDFLRDAGGQRITTVAETIFPMSYYRRKGSAGVYDTFPAHMRAIRSVRSADRSWGTYALRLVQSRTDGRGRTYLPLQDAITKIKTKGQYRAAHELNLGPVEEDIDIYNPDTDRLRGYGGPCLSHLSFKVYDGCVRLNATYRSHYYVQRLFGNMLGLAYLQVFVARECGLTVGPLTINSTYAELDAMPPKMTCGRRGWTKRDAKALIARCRAIATTATSSAAATPPTLPVDTQTPSAA